MLTSIKIPEYICSKCKRGWPEVSPSKTGVCFRCQRDYYYFNKFGVGIDQFERMIKDQGGRCAVGGEVFPERIYDGGGHGGDRPVLDHDHDTGNARGVLCGRCNQILGTIDGGVEGWFLRAFEYLKKHGSIGGGWSIVQEDTKGSKIKKT
jgi:Recombination endonuclease VII